MNVGKDGKWDEKMEFFNGKDGIDGGSWTVKTDAEEHSSAASEREKQGNNRGGYAGAGWAAG